MADSLTKQLVAFYGFTPYKADILKQAIRKRMVTMTAEAKQKADGLYKKAQGTPTKCTLSMRGDAHFTAKNVVEVRGIGTRLSGNYYVSDVTHTVAPGVFTMTGKARRDGTSAHGGANPGAKSDAAAVVITTLAHEVCALVPVRYHKRVASLARRALERVRAVAP